MSQSNVEAVQQVYKAIKDGDVAGMSSLIAPTVRIWQTEELPWGGHYEGPSTQSLEKLS
jgi:ketosteroid isomerase-like protein